MKKELPSWLLRAFMDQLGAMERTDFWGEDTQAPGKYSREQSFLTVVWTPLWASVCCEPPDSCLEIMHVQVCAFGVGGR